MPQAVEGPFHWDLRLVRADIREGRPGIPLLLARRVIEAANCALAGEAGRRLAVRRRGPVVRLPGAGGRGMSIRGRTCLRGGQTTDMTGRVRFGTIYPGWYVGRAEHIHVKAFLDGRTMLTGQTYFPNTLSEFLDTQVPAYGAAAASGS